jgi:hypothetical protein
MDWPTAFAFAAAWAGMAAIAWAEAFGKRKDKRRGDDT